MKKSTLELGIKNGELRIRHSGLRGKIRHSQFTIHNSNRFLVIDIGNTSTKWALANARGLSKAHEVSTDSFRRPGNRHAALLRRLGKNLDGAIISSVVPGALPGVRRLLRRLGVSRPILVTSKMDLGIGIRYPDPKRIGADRLVNSVAAVELYGAPAIVVDFGTAVTFDVISAKKEYLGGAIAPGLSAMTDYLHEHTALLPHISLAEPKSAIGKNTVAAMRIGAVIGYRGLVLELLNSICRELGLRPAESKARNPKRVQVIATGGHSTLISSKVKCIQHVDPLLTLRGLRLIYLRNSK